jgi:hypothetical protein
MSNQRVIIMWQKRRHFNVKCLVFLLRRCLVAWEHDRLMVIHSDGDDETAWTELTLWYRSRSVTVEMNRLFWRKKLWPVFLIYNSLFLAPRINRQLFFSGMLWSPPRDSNSTSAHPRTRTAESAPSQGNSLWILLNTFKHAIFFEWVASEFKTHWKIPQEYLYVDIRSREVVEKLLKLSKRQRSVNCPLTDH